MNTRNSPNRRYWPSLTTASPFLTWEFRLGLRTIASGHKSRPLGFFVTERRCGREGLKGFEPPLPVRWCPARDRTGEGAKSQSTVEKQQMPPHFCGGICHSNPVLRYLAAFPMAQPALMEPLSAWLRENVRGSAHHRFEISCCQLSEITRCDTGHDVDSQMMLTFVKTKLRHL